MPPAPDYDPSAAYATPPPTYDPSSAYATPPPAHDPSPAYAPPASDYGPPAAYAPPPPAQPPLPHASYYAPVPGTVRPGHDPYGAQAEYDAIPGATPGGPGVPGGPNVPGDIVVRDGRKRPSGWNAPAYGMLALFLAALAIVIYPQYRAHQTEAKLKPLVVGLVGKPTVWARCPRYLTSVLTNVGSVSIDSKNRPADHTNLTGPICKGLRHLYTPEGHAEMHCLTSGQPCTQGALNSVIAMSTITHESMHLKGVEDEGQAECTSIQAATQAGQLAGLTADEGRMIGYLHLMSLNPNTPERYQLNQHNCPQVADLVRNPPGNPATREQLVAEANRTWMDIASG